jgi:hypothetical protein
VSGVFRGLGLSAWLGGVRRWVGWSEGV